MNLTEIAQKLNSDFKFPHQLIRKEHNLGDTILIQISLDSQADWKFENIQNSRMFSALIFCTGQKERTNDSYTFEGVVNRTGFKVTNKLTAVSGEQIYNHIKTQLSKLIDKK